jgi:hypothetical protein
MTPEDAAAILRLRPNPSAGDVERAFRARARVLHPDRLSGASDAEIAAAAEQFALLTEAHQVMQHAIAEAPVIATIDPVGRARVPRWLIVGWLMVMLVAGVISYYGGAIPYSTADVVLRLLPLAAAVTAFAVTGRRIYYAVALALLAASVIITLALASFGSLVALGLLLAPVVGLMVLGKRIAPYRA